jgi:outer membrane immunogenic protein
MRTAIAAVSVWTVVGPMIAGPAAASDLGRATDVPVKAAPYVAPSYDWTGFYVGGHVGPGWSGATLTDRTGATFAPPGTGVNVSGSGWHGGAQFGYNMQLGAWVFGIEGDLSYTDVRGTTTAPLGASVDTRANWIGTVTGRLGFAWDRTLLYAKAGAAFSEGSYRASVPLVVDFQGKDTRAGWTVGAGAEYALWDNFSVKAEYNYIDLGTRTVTLTPPAGASILADAKITEHMIKLGANYKFSWR